MIPGNAETDNKIVGAALSSAWPRVQQAPENAGSGAHVEARVSALRGRLLPLAGTPMALESGPLGSTIKAADLIRV